MKIFKQRGHVKDSEPEPVYDSEPIFLYPPSTCRFCDGKGCIMCEDQTPIRAARLRLPDMTIKQRP
jgi:hypothetical protein